MVARNIARAVWLEHEHQSDGHFAQPARPRVVAALRRWADALEHRSPKPVPMAR